MRRARTAWQGLIQKWRGGRAWRSAKAIPAHVGVKTEPAIAKVTAAANTALAAPKAQQPDGLAHGR